MIKNDRLIIANKKYFSRLIVGTGKYKSMKECAKAIKISGAEIVTVAVRRVNISDKSKPLLMDYIDPKKITYLPNTAGCFTSNEALRTLRLAREIGGWKLVKLEVLGDKKNLFPDMIETLKSTKVLTKEGFQVMVYCNDDPLMAKKLENAGASAIMPLAAPIGSVICGSKEFIRSARRIRKSLGGGMRQTGIISAAGIVGLKEMTSRLKEDHQHAKHLAQSLHGLSGIKVDPKLVPTNIIYFNFDHPNISASEFVDHMQSNGIIFNDYNGKHCRLVLHHGISSDDVENVIDVFKKLLS